jgi:hypothetical protein
VTEDTPETRSKIVATYHADITLRDDSGAPAFEIGELEDSIRKGLESFHDHAAYPNVSVHVRASRTDD